MKHVYSTILNFDQPGSNSRKLYSSSVAKHPDVKHLIIHLTLCYRDKRDVDENEGADELFY